MTGRRESEFVERIARAMQNAVAKGRFALHTHHARALGRGALAAMREPSKAMRRAGGKALAEAPSQPNQGATMAADRAWRSMIDKALS